MDSKILEGLTPIGEITGFPLFYSLPDGTLIGIQLDIKTMESSYQAFDPITLEKIGKGGPCAGELRLWQGQGLVCPTAQSLLDPVTGSVIASLPPGVVSNSTVDFAILNELVDPEEPVVYRVVDSSGALRWQAPSGVAIVGLLDDAVLTVSEAGEARSGEVRSLADGSVRAQVDLGSEMIYAKQALDGFVLGDDTSTSGFTPDGKLAWRVDSTAMVMTDDVSLEDIKVAFGRAGDVDVTPRMGGGADGAASLVQYVDGHEMVSYGLLEGDEYLDGHLLPPPEGCSLLQPKMTGDGQAMVLSKMCDGKVTRMVSDTRGNLRSLDVGLVQFINRERAYFSDVGPDGQWSATLYAVGA